ncbi:hypothetical protein KQY30_20025 [Streptomyces sp. GMY02]|uniref:hypothetical protein n=1 Tax=Streptomyces sp. GMY02 TaxID=1333528 RepID=UPI001C2BD4FE|nr:hypothetical protein [Streptomyces sp. GMY02]QXE36188.1 hypothetical protein KQY30_20025 [Streptomyces sp. GMY02]
MSDGTETGLSPVHDLLAAIVDMIDVPRPEEYSEQPTYYRLLEARASMLRGYLNAMVERRREPAPYHAVGIREMTADLPVTYRPYTRPEDGEGTC